MIVALSFSPIMTCVQSPESQAPVNVLLTDVKSTEYRTSSVPAGASAREAALAVKLVTAMVVTASAAAVAPASSFFNFI